PPQVMPLTAMVFHSALSGTGRLATSPAASSHWLQPPPSSPPPQLPPSAIVSPQLPPCSPAAALACAAWSPSITLTGSTGLAADTGEVLWVEAGAWRDSAWRLSQPDRAPGT